MHHVGMAAGSRQCDASSVGGGREPAACGGSDVLFSRDRGRYQRHGSDALLLRDALLMHHVGMAVGSRLGDASLVGGRWEPAACGGSDALFSRDRGRYQRHGSDVLLLRDALLMHHQLSAGGNQQRAAGVMH